MAIHMTAAAAIRSTFLIGWGFLHRLASGRRPRPGLALPRTRHKALWPTQRNIRKMRAWPAWRMLVSSASSEPIRGRPGHRTPHGFVCYRLARPFSSTRLTSSRHNRAAASPRRLYSSSEIVGSAFRPTITVGFAAGSPGVGWFGGEGEGDGSWGPTVTRVIFGPGFGLLVRRGGRAVTISGRLVSTVAMSGRSPAWGREGTNSDADRDPGDGRRRRAAPALAIAAASS
jgi:hypothetical protein